MITKAYHAALPKKQRNAIQTEWQTDVIPLIVCTIAFGMGIDVSTGFSIVSVF